MEVKSYFLDGIVEVEVFIKQPLGYIKETRDKQVYKFKKALYVIKQTPYA